MIRPILLIALLFVGLSVRSQQIRIVDFICKGCKRQLKPVTQADLQAMIDKETSLLTACNKIRGNFSPDLGDHFILAQIGPNGELETMCFPFSSNFPPSRKSRRGFFAFKGDVEIYQFADLQTLFRDSLAIFDTLRLDFGKMAYLNEDVLQSLRIKYTIGSKKYEKTLDYDTLNKTILLTYQDIFGTGLSRKTTDALKVSVQYKDEGKNIVLSPRIRLFFLTDMEEQDLTQILSYYRSITPAWTDEVIAGELQKIVSVKYKQVLKSDLLAWLKKQHVN